MIPIIIQESREDDYEVLDQMLARKAPSAHMESFQCQCRNRSHVLTFSLDHGGGGEVDLDVSFYLQHYKSFWQRLKTAFYYLFNVDTADFDGMLFCPEDSKRLQALLQEFDASTQPQVDKKSDKLSDEEFYYRNMMIALSSEERRTSSISKICNNENYKGIIKLGSRAIPYLIADLDNEDVVCTWAIFPALKEITGIDPVPAQYTGSIFHMKKYWEEWYCNRLVSILTTE